MPLNKKNLNNLFYIFITSHLIIWTLVPTFTNHNLPLDTIEHLAWGSNLDWGFDKHPPLVAVFLEFFYQMFGPQDWAYYFLSQIFVIISFFIIYKFSIEIFDNKILGLFSVLIIESIYFYNFTTPEFNVNVCQLPFWSLTVYYSWKIYKNNKINFIDCLLVGLFAGFGFLSKYLFIYLLISIDLLFIYLIFIKKQRKFDFKYLITFEAFIIILIPHLIWLFNNDYVTIKYGLSRTGVEEASVIDHLKYPIVFVVKQVAILIPFFVLLWTLVKKIKFKGVDLILDYIGGEYINKNINLLANDGKLINIGFQNGSSAEINLMKVMLKRLTISGSTLRIRDIEFKNKILKELIKFVFPYFKTGQVKCYIDSVFSLSEASKAHKRLDEGVHIGKVILKI